MAPFTIPTFRNIKQTSNRPSGRNPPRLFQFRFGIVSTASKFLELSKLTGMGQALDRQVRVLTYHQGDLFIHLLAASFASSGTPQALLPFGMKRLAQAWHKRECFRQIWFGVDSMSAVPSRSCSCVKSSSSGWLVTDANGNRALT